MKFKFLGFAFSFLMMILFITGCSGPTVIRPLVFTPKTPLPIPHKPNPNVILVLSGGNARGYAHLGVLKVLKEHHIPIDIIIGTNTGSLVGVVYADKNNIAQTTKILLSAGPSEFLDVSTFNLLEGALSGDELENFILKNVHAKNFNHLRTPFIAVATDLKTGQPIPLGSGPIAPAIHAASALPPYYHPISLYGHVLVDGTTTDPVPVDVAKMYHPKMIIAVNLAESLAKAAPTTVVSIYNRVNEIGDRVFYRLTSEGADIVIHPQVPVTYATDTKQRLALIAAGEKATKKALPAICALLRQHHISSSCGS